LVGRRCRLTPLGAPLESAEEVEMRYFAGMSESEVAEALQVNERTVRRDWEKARVLLAAQLK